ncbi:hypothetical protein TNCV_2745791 [Trichonephila clavipes]|nr:hypothetical protein TNCV_2745791 [Trichonephila clavipes]
MVPAQAGGVCRNNYCCVNEKTEKEKLNQTVLPLPVFRIFFLRLTNHTLRDLTLSAIYQTTNSFERKILLSPRPALTNAKDCGVVGDNWSPAANETFTVLTRCRCKVNLSRIHRLILQRNERQINGGDVSTNAAYKDTGFLGNTGSAVVKHQSAAHHKHDLAIRNLKHTPTPCSLK